MPSSVITAPSLRLPGGPAGLSHWPPTLANTRPSWHTVLTTPPSRSTLPLRLSQAESQDFVDLKQTLQRAATAPRCVRGMFGNKLYSHSILVYMQLDSAHSTVRTILRAFAPLLHRALTLSQQTPQP